jgi:hypothetical protein
MRLFGKWIITLFVIAITALTIFIAFLQSPYGPNMIHGWAKWRYNIHLNIKQVDYQLTQPWQITFHDLNLPTQQTTVKTFTVQLTPWHLPYTHWALESVTLTGVTKKKVDLDISLPKLTVKTIHVKNGQWKNAHSALPNNQLTITHWHNLQNRPVKPTIIMESLNGTWQKKSFKKMTMTVTPLKSTWRFDFHLSWDNNRLQAFGEWHLKNRHLKLKQIRFSPLYIASSHEKLALTTYLQTQLNHYAIQKIDIDRLTLQEGHFSTHNFQAENLTLEIQNWQWPKTHWQQNQAHVQLTADRLTWQNTPFQNITLQSRLTPNQLNITQAQGNVFQGFMTLEGKFSPTHWQIIDLNLNGMRFTNSLILPKIPLPKKISINQLQWQQGQYLDVKRQFTLDSPNLMLKNMKWQFNRRWIAHTGVIKLSSPKGQWLGRNFTAAILQAEKVDQYWQLNQFQLPIKDGLIAAKGHINIRDPDWPWQLTLDAKNIPTDLLTESLNLPIKMTGEWDVTGNLSGSGESFSAFKHSLTGKIYGEGRGLRLYVPQVIPLLTYWSQWEKNHTQSFNEIAQESVSVTPWQLEFDRGIVQIPPILLTGDHITAQLKGQWGLAKKEANRLILDAQNSCQQLHRIWPDPQGVSSLSRCNLGNNKYVP